MKELIEEYKSLGLDEGLAITAIIKGISPEQIKRIRICVINFQKSMEEVAQTMLNALQNNKDFLKEIEDMRAKEIQEVSIKKRGKKGKNIKVWQKNKFYQRG